MKKVIREKNDSCIGVSLENRAGAESIARKGVIIRSLLPPRITESGADKIFRPAHVRRHNA